ncbi:hypothetical protein [Micromonospora sp. NPDC049274]|uniref:hypothetical protein n=1 Tax=Micromonospora sp. NPDC049274 TaxID=3154829 RepID=UPI00342A7CD7
MLLGVVALVLNAVLLLLKFGSIRTLLFLRKLNIALRGIPGDTLLSCTGNKVSVLAYASRGGGEQLLPFYTGVLTWKGGPKLAVKLKKRAARQIAIRSVIFFVLFVPLVAGSAWLTMFRSWHAVWLLALLGIHQVWPFRIWAWPGLMSTLDRD